jgi:hypothetical protein
LILNWPANELPNAAFVMGRVDLGTVFIASFRPKDSVRFEA